MVAGLLVTTILSGVAASVVAWKSGMTLPISLSITHRDGAKMDASTRLAARAGNGAAKARCLDPEGRAHGAGEARRRRRNDVPFTLTLDSAEPLPPRSTLVISGLSDGMVFSAGTPLRRDRVEPHAGRDWRTELERSSKCDGRARAQRHAADGGRNGDRAARRRFSPSETAAEALWYRGLRSADASTSSSRMAAR